MKSWNCIKIGHNYVYFMNNTNFEIILDVMNEEKSERERKIYINNFVRKRRGRLDI